MYLSLIGVVHLSDLCLINLGVFVKGSNRKGLHSWGFIPYHHVYTCRRTSWGAGAAAAPPPPPLEFFKSNNFSGKKSSNIRAEPLDFWVLYTPLFSHTVIFAVLARCSTCNSRGVNFAILLMLSLL